MGRPRRNPDTLAPSTRRIYDALRRRTVVSPRVRIATNLYESGAARTKKEAAELVGLKPATLYMATTLSPAVQALSQTAQQIVADKSLSMTVLMEKLSRRAVEVVGGLMEDAGKEEVRLKAAQDLLDRNPATAKNTRIAVEQPMISERDVQHLAEALVRGAQMREKFSGVIEGDYIMVEEQSTQRALPSGESSQ